MLKKNITLIILFILFITGAASAFATENYTLKAGVSMIDRVPKSLFGVWRVTSSVVDTNSSSTFKKNSVDLWNLSRTGDVITLVNPFSGAEASVTLDEVNGNLIKFKKVGDYDNKKLTDIVQLTLGKDSFTGTNTLILNTLSEDKQVIKTEKATYKLNGEKISGANIK